MNKEFNYHRQVLRFVGLADHQQIIVRVFEDQKGNTAYILDLAEDFRAIQSQKIMSCPDILRQEEKQGLGSVKLLLT